MLKHPAGEYDRAKRIFKQLKAGVREFEELELEEVGLLAVYYPHVLPCGECDRS
jgi:hypothetical protein